MTQDKFDEVIDYQIMKCRNFLTLKEAEYAPQGTSDECSDRLAHFKKAAIVMNSTPKMALMGMLSKHIVSVSDMCTGGNKYPKWKWDEKITDSINYLMLLRALVEEESDE